MLSQCLDNSRLLTAELSPRVLYEVGLGPALKWLGHQYEIKHVPICEGSNILWPMPNKNAEVMKCQRECEAGAITVTDNLATIDSSKCTQCGHCAEICPRHIIKPQKS